MRTDVTDFSSAGLLGNDVVMMNAAVDSTSRSLAATSAYWPVYGILALFKKKGRQVRKHSRFGIWNPNPRSGSVLMTQIDPALLLKDL